MSSSVNVTKSAGNCRLIIFTEEILNGKFHFLSSAKKLDPGFSFYYNWKQIVEVSCSINS